MIAGPVGEVNRFSRPPRAPAGLPAARTDGRSDADARGDARRRMRAVGQDRRAGRRRRRAGAGARPAPRPATVETPVDVFLPRYRGVPVPTALAARRPWSASRIRARRRATARSRSSTSPPTATGSAWSIIPPAFDREGFYGDAAGDYADNAWRFGLFCRAALEALRADDRPLDVLHLHDWHTGPAAIYRDERYADDPIIGGAAMVMTLHNLAYHGWTPRDRLAQLGLRPGDGVVGLDAPGIDLLLAGIERAEIVNTVSPGVRRARR